jgi:ubiquinone/menaquinone biosynthesis C-methylase UbiE
MKRRVCPWWLGYVLANPIRRLWHNPREILQPFVKERMLVLEPGPGMGFFTLDLARLVGRNGKVIAVDVQPKMFAGLERRARKAGLLDRIETRLVKPDNMDLSDLDGKVDFVFACYMIHELPDAARFLDQMRRALRAGRQMLVAEPAGHVKETDFAALIETAKRAGFEVREGPDIRSSRTAILSAGKSADTV